MSFAFGVNAADIACQGLDLEPFEGKDVMAFVLKVMGEGVSGRAETDDEDFVTRCRLRQRSREVHRVPARQQRVDLETPRKVENVLEHASLDLRNIDGFLLLIDAGLHAIIADPVAGSGAHGIVDDNNGEGGKGMAGAEGLMHL